MGFIWFFTVTRQMSNIRWHWPLANLTLDLNGGVNGILPHRAPVVMNFSQCTGNRVVAPTIVVTIVVFCVAVFCSVPALLQASSLPW